MADRYGVVITQDDSDINTVADYKKSYDSRVKTLEIHKYGTITFTVPAAAANPSGTNATYVRFDILSNELGFYPMFEIYEVSNSTSAYGNYYMDKKSLCFVYSYNNLDGMPASTIKINYRIYNLDVDIEITPIVSSFDSYGTPNISRGVRILDDSSQSLLENNSMFGTSLDTTRKTINIHSLIKHSGVLDDVQFYHGVGYPPTYILSNYAEQPFVAYYVGHTIPFRNDYFCTNTSLNNITGKCKADKDYISFRGVQSIMFGNYAILILKDYADISE